jgi:heme exporter protein CcmD
MEHLHGWFVAAAYAVSAVVLAADAILPRIKFQSLLRGILLRERRTPNPDRTTP